MPFLQSLGYHKSARSFWLEVNGIYRIVNFQAGSQNTPEQASFTINLQLTFPCFHEVLVASPFPKNPANAAMVLQTRMGHLLPPRGDRWWGVTKQTVPATLGREVVGLLNEHGVPWLCRFSGVADIADFVGSDLARQYLHGNLALFRAIISWCRGQSEQARKTLEELKRVNKVRGYDETISLIEERINKMGAASCGKGRA